MISLDTETTGIDFHYGCKPFLVTICTEEGNTYWEWPVDPFTRQPSVPAEDLEEMQEVINEAEEIVLQNAVFDVQALDTVFADGCVKPKATMHWNWSKVHDTLIAGHLLSSNGKHDLANMAIEYLGIDIRPYEARLKQAVEECRRWCRKERPDWRIAKAGLPEMPSAKRQVWKNDGWLPKAVADSCSETDNAAGDKTQAGITNGTDVDFGVCSEYANADSLATLELWKVQRELLKKRGLWNIYKERLKVLPVVYEMEARGVTLHRGRLEQQIKEYRTESERLGRVCVNVAKSYGYELELPKSGNNKSLKHFIFGYTKVTCDCGREWVLTGIVKNSNYPDCPECEELDKAYALGGEEYPGLALPQIEWSNKTGEPSMDKATVEHWANTLPARSKQLRFVKSLAGKRKRDTAVNYLEGYRRFWKQVDKQFETDATSDHYKLYPRFNPIGTDTLRWSSSNPNAQNVGKDAEFNLRYPFGPLPGREWWALDYQNLELRIPSYEAGESDLIEVFEHPERAPYYGSYHLVVADLLHPELFAEHGAAFKNIFKSSWYQWVKNGDFALIYGGYEDTVDATFKVPGAYAKIQKRFPKIAKLSREQRAKADRLGYVETMSDREVDPKRGYPLQCSRSEYNRIKPTVPFNYFVQGTACWIMTRATVKVQEYLQGVQSFYLIMQIHDELVIDCPTGHNSGKIRKVAKLMESCGAAVGVPTPVSVEKHTESWGKKE